MMNENMIQTEIDSPTVFISYSHDTPEHRQWVTRLAGKLISEGHIKVKIDIWDTSPGEDLGLFMDKGVKESQRVIMVCSETYSQKVDDGFGGAGYEGGIVRAELIGRMEEARFIPIIPPGNSSRRVPVCIGSKKYIDMSDSSKEDDAFVELVSAIRQYLPLQKPALNLSSMFTKFEEMKQKSHSEQTINSNSDSYSPIECFAKAQQLIVKGNMVLWKDFLGINKQIFFQKLIEHRQNNERNNFDEENAVSMVKSASISMQNLVAAIAAGIESEEDRFMHHSALLADILHPIGWNTNGLCIFTDLPSSMGFIYHYYCGAIAVNTRLFNLVFENANFKIVFDRHTTSLVNSHTANGFEDSYCRSFVNGAEILKSLFKEWDLSSVIFKTEDNFRASLLAYNILLIYCSLLSCPKTEVGGQDALLQWRIPPIFLFVGEYGVRRIAKQKIMTDVQQIQSYMRERGIASETLVTCWDKYLSAWEKGGCLYRYFIDDAIEDFRDFTRELLQ